MPDAFGNPLPGETTGDTPPAAAPPPPQSAATALASDSDMTPGKAMPPTILGTSWRSTGGKDHGPAEAWQESGSPGSRIETAATTAFRDTPPDDPGNMSPITSSYQQKMNAAPGPFGWINRNIINPGFTGLGYGIHGVEAGGAAIGQGVQEVMRATGLPAALRRDLTILPQAVSPGLSEVSLAGSALASNPTARVLMKEPNPSYTGDTTGYLKPADVTPPKGGGLLGLSDDTAPRSPTGVPGPFGQPSGYTPPPVNPSDAAGMRSVADFLHTKAQQSGATLGADYTNRFVDNVTADEKPPGPGSAAMAGPNDPVGAQVQRLQGLKGQELNIGDVMGMDKTLNGQIRSALISDPPTAVRLQGIQDRLRDQIEGATQADVGGGAAGWQAFSDWRDAYSQYKKMQQLEDIRDKAIGTDQEATTIQKNITKWANDPNKRRGLTDDERATLTAAGEPGYMGEIMRSGAGRLATQAAAPVAGTIIGGGIGTLTGFPAVGSLIGYGAGQTAQSVVSTAIRNLRNNAQLGRVSDALKTLGAKVPYPPDMPPPAGGP